MKLVRLKLHNYKSYADCELNLANLSACSIIGGNGAGKSTLVEAIVWALYGSAKLSNKDLIRSGSDRVYVELDIEINEKVYQIEREYDDGKMSLSVKVDGRPVAQGSKNLAAIIAKAVGASKELLHESVVIPQGQLNSFIKSTPAQRRDLVASILGLDKYAAAWDTAKESLKQMTIAVASRSGTIESIEKQIEAMPTHVTLDEEIKTHNETLTRINGEIAELTQKHERMLAEDRVTRETHASLGTTVLNLTSKIANAEVQFDEQIKRLEADVRVCDQRIVTIENLRGMLPSLDIRLKEANDALAAIAQTTKEMEDCNREIDRCRKRIVVIKEGGDTCPLCGSNVDAAKWQQITLSIENEMRSLMETLSKIPKLQPNGKPETIVSEITETKERIAKLEGQQDTKQVFLNQLDSIKAQKEQVLAGLRGELAAATQTLALIKGKLNTEIDTVANEIAVKRSSHEACSNKLIQCASTKQSRETLENSLKDAETNLALFKQKLPETEFVAAALSPTGIPLMITDYYMPLIAQRTQELLHMMSDGQLNVKIEVIEAGTKKGIELLAGTDTLRPIESLSGGEGTRVSLALRVALSQILQEMSGCHFNCLIVDEPEYLDSVGISQFIATINTLRDQYQQIFVMSHIDSIKNSFPSAIMVTKINEVSDAQII